MKTNYASTKVIAFANWENKTADAIASRAGGDRLRKLEGDDAEELLARRHRVAELYNREMEQWEYEVSIYIYIYPMTPVPSKHYNNSSSVIRMI